MSLTPTDLLDFTGCDEMPPAFFEHYQPTVEAIAAREWKRSDIYTIEDITQSIWEHALLNWKHYAGVDSDHVTKFMTRAARGFVRKQRVDYMYFTGAFVYTPKLVRAYLETCAWQPLDEVPDIDARVDIREAFELLRESSPKQAAAIFKRHGLGDDASTFSDAEQKSYERGIDSLTHRLNVGLRLAAESVELTSTGA